MMLRLLATASLLLSASQVYAFDGCNNPAYYPCPPQTSSGGGDGGGGGGSGGFGATLPPSLLSGGLGFPSNVQNTAGDPVLGSDDDGGGDSSDPGGSGRRLTIRAIAERQNTALCCRPAPVQCRIWTEYNVPFCYDPSDTRWFFADGSEYFADNGTFFGADGYDVDFVTGDYSWPNGTTGNIYADAGESPPSSSTLALAAATSGASAAPTAAGTATMGSVSSAATPSASMTGAVSTASMAGTASAATGTASGTAAPKSDAALVVRAGTFGAGLVAVVLAAAYTL